MIEQFIRERMYLKGVSPNTVLWYRDSFSAFQGAIDSKPAIVQRIGELTQRGVKPVSINTYLRCINAYFRWLHEEHKAELIRIPRLKDEQKILATLSAEQTQNLIRFKPKGTNLSRAHLLALLLLDTVLF
jgi:site-specific recombinase XerD